MGQRSNHREQGPGLRSQSERSQAQIWSSKPVGVKPVRGRPVMPSIASLLFCVSLCLDFVAIQAQSGSGGLVVSSDGKKREELRWFPANNISDCDAEPGLEQVREERPSLACREDEERSVCVAELGEMGTTTWRFLCGTCNISFKLDRRKGL